MKNALLLGIALITAGGETLVAQAPVSARKATALPATFSPTAFFNAQFQSTNYSLSPVPDPSVTAQDVDSWIFSPSTFQAITPVATALQPGAAPVAPSTPPPTARPAQTSPQRPARRTSAASTRYVSTGPTTSSAAIALFLSSPARRYAVRMPEMMGDFGLMGPRMILNDFTTAGVQALVKNRAPVASGLNRLRIAEFNQAMPTDRVFASYNYYRNVSRYQHETATGSFRGHNDVHRWTMGMESTLEDGRSSVELRLPIGFSTFDPVFLPAGSSAVASDAGIVGNVSVLLKRIGALTDYGVVSYGLGLETPTGSDTVFLAGSTRYTIGNRVLHLSPFLALTGHDGQGDWFCHGFGQLDIPLGAEPITSRDRVTLVTTNSSFQDPLRLLADFGVGRWVFTDTQSGWDAAVLAELHTVTSLGDGQSRLVERVNVFGSTVAGNFTPQAGTVVNSTVGLHLRRADGFSARFGAAFPLAGSLFDGEAMAQIGKKY